MYLFTLFFTAITVNTKQYSFIHVDKMPGLYSNNYICYTLKQLNYKLQLTWFDILKIKLIIIKIFCGNIHNTVLSRILNGEINSEECGLKINAMM